MLERKLTEDGIKPGRDRFFAAPRRLGLLPEPFPASVPQTMNSRHSLPVLRNLVKDMELTRSNKAPGADITYIRSKERFAERVLIHDT